MPKFSCCLPIVGYACVEVEADDEEQALDRALMTPWDELDIVEEYPTDKVVQGNVCYHPMSRADIQEIEDDVLTGSRRCQ